MDCVFTLLLGGKGRGESRSCPVLSSRREELVRANGSIIFRETQDLSFVWHAPPACQVALPSFYFPVSYKEGRAHERHFLSAGGVNTASTLDGIIWGRFMAIGP